MDGYCSTEVPEYVSTSNDDDDLPVRWKAPECVMNHRYSTSSDVWAFGVLMYEMLTHGCTPYRDVFHDDEVPLRVSLQVKLGISIIDIDSEGAMRSHA